MEYSSQFMQAACIEAMKAVESKSGGPFGCVIVQYGKIIGRGHNQVLHTNDPTCHGEVAAIRDACNNMNSFDLSLCDLYTTGEPCGMCLYACFWANIQTVYYGCSLEDNSFIGFRDDHLDRVTHISRDDLKHGPFEFLQQKDRAMCFEVFKAYMSSQHQLY